MVSVVESPSKFFVQKCGTLSKDLDCLIDDMTEFYSKGDNRLQYAAPKVNKQLVITHFKLIVA
jgi:hypothetical protein